MGECTDANGSNFDNELLGIVFAYCLCSLSNQRGKKDVKLMKKFISEEIMLSFPAPHKLDLSVRSDINESGDNEKGEIIEG